MKKIILIFILFNFLSGCQSAKDALTLKKKPASDEFLVQKKSPLVLPPNFDEIPKPGSKSKINTDENDNIKKILKAPETNNVSKNKSSSIEEAILDKIKE